MHRSTSEDLCLWCGSVPERDSRRARPPDLNAGLAEVARALGDAHRIEIVQLLASTGEPVSIQDLIQSFRIAQSTLSHHLRVLVDAGICERARRGRNTWYSLRAEAVMAFRHRLEWLLHVPVSP